MQHRTRLGIGQSEDYKLLLLATCQPLECKVVLRRGRRILLEEARLSVLVYRHLYIRRQRTVDIPALERYALQLVVALRVGRGNLKTIAHSHTRNWRTVGVANIAIYLAIVNFELVLLGAERLKIGNSLRLVGDGLKLANNTLREWLAWRLMRHHLLARGVDKFYCAVTNLYRRQHDIEDALRGRRESVIIRQ